ncbi:F-actin-uncapping protein LRRC16A-like isoform X1 [Acipenser ruthenus]|uniref:F-actin-uncapping protein LRRC16A-like isoform X1 n=1 Tax=Acipenser ruthenus TaxID=7906 RepID=UPI00274186B6|nr:F-actin-uncapping protein LRRC16A-like isoform X1 [Acipenser ruthenus]
MPGGAQCFISSVEHMVWLRVCDSSGCSFSRAAANYNMTEAISDVPKELLESIKDVLGRKIKIAVKKKVKLEIKGDKVENKVLALASHRAYLLTARIPTKLEQTFNYFEIQGINCSKPGHLAVEYERGLASMKLASSEDVNEVVAHIGNCLQRICPGLSPLKILKKVAMEPPERLVNLQALWNTQNVVEPGPCGGFSHMYKCVCDWLGFPYREEVQWDVDTIYLTQDTRELNVQDFSHLYHRDLIPIIAVLEYNQWFTKLSSKDLKLSADVCEQILRVVSRSSRLEELVLENAGLKTDFAQKLANALALNPCSGLHTINLTNNALEDRGLFSLSIQFAKLPKGLKHLNISKTSLSPKGVNSLAQSLSANQLVPSTLSYLDLSGNLLRGDDLSNLYSFLALPNSLTVLDVSNSDCALDMMCGALTRGCLQHLAVLNFSKTVFSHRKGKDVPPSFKQFFSSSLALSSITMSGTKLPPEALKSLLLGLACNPHLKDVSLDLSCCELRSGGSQILEGCIAEIPNISSLDISDNGLDSDLTTLVVWLSKNRSIQHLALGKNFNNIKSKNLARVLDNLVHMIQDEESPLTSLSLADSKLKSDLTIILNALGSNTSLTKVDISGNGMGDMGAKMLAKALQINTKLRTVIWDKNNISPQGLQDIAVALEKNFTLRCMPIPINDASQALKANQEKTEDALQKIENYLTRNHETRKYLQEQAYRLQQGIVTTTTQQMVNRMCVKVQDHLNSLRNSETDSVVEDVKMAENFMRDARNSKALLPNLYHLGGASWTGANGSSSNPIHEKLESMAGEVTLVVDEQLKTQLESMVDAAERLCPHVMMKTNIRHDLIEASTEKMSIPRTFVKNVLLEQSGIDILNKISEVKLSVASFLSDRIVDEILESLSSSQHKLAEHLTRRGTPLVHQESLEIEVMEEKLVKRSTLTAEDLTEIERLEELDTCMTLCCTSMTPKSKRKSIHSRMLRPVSRAFEMEFDLDKALEAVPIYIEDLPVAHSMLEKRCSGAIPELPSEEGKKLEHFTKLRPKRNKKQQPSKMTQVSAASSQEGEQNGLMGRVDEGVDEFFSKKVTRINTKKRSSLKSSNSQDGGETEEKKKRDSRKSSFFNLIKSRSSKSERPQTVAVSEEPLSPKSSVKSPAVEPTSPKSSVKGPAVEPSKVKEVKPVFTDQSSSSDRSEELKTPDSMDEHSEDSLKGDSKPEGKGSPQGGRRYGVQVMGCGLLAEMKAKQEKRAAVVHKAHDSTSSTARHDGSGSATTGHNTPSESRLPGAKGDSTENNLKSEAKPEAGVRLHSSSITPTSPKPPPQTTKPSLIGWQKPWSSRSTEEGPESSTESLSLLPHSLKRGLSEKERDGQSSPLFSGSGSCFPAQEVHPTSMSEAAQRQSSGQHSEDNGSKPKEQSPNKGQQGNKSCDSGEEGDKDFTFE